MVPPLVSHGVFFSFFFVSFSHLLLRILRRLSCPRTYISSLGVAVQAKLQEEPSDTPLQEKLDAMAAMIGYVGMACAAATFVATMCVYFTTHRVSEWVLIIGRLADTFMCFLFIKFLGYTNYQPTYTRNL